MKVLLKYNLFLLLMACFFTGCNNALPEMVTEQGNALGTTYTIKYEVINGPGTIKTELDSIVNAVNRSMSTYLPDSDISRVNRGDTAIVVNHYFKAVFRKAREVWQQTGGKFDPTVGALVNAWGFGPENALKELSQQQIDSILRFTGFDKVSLSEDGRIVKAHKAVYLDFNALAKGYTIDLIGRMLDEKGIKNYLVELGGEILARGINTQTGNSWTVAIDDPLQQTEKRTLLTRLPLTDRAIATSGNYRKFRIDPESGMRYNHIINPKTGYPQKNNILSVSVLADTCMEADAYATAFMLMTLPEIKALQHNGIEVYVIAHDEKGELTTYATKGFGELPKG